MKFGGSFDALPMARRRSMKMYTAIRESIARGIITQRVPLFVNKSEMGIVFSPRTTGAARVSVSCTI
ncbi:MAG: hypothetical protein ACE5DN_05660 [Flavobacteriales bacterium]